MARMLRGLVKVPGNPYVFASLLSASGRIAEPRAPHAAVLSAAGIPHVSIVLRRVVLQAALCGIRLMPSRREIIRSRRLLNLSRWVVVCRAHMASRAESAKSAAKAKAARVNGAKGGRPRKAAAAS